MACILNIETSGQLCSLALTYNSTTLLERTDTENTSHAKNLGVFAEEALAFARSHNYPIDAVAVSAGPGSYTGLRIGVSEAKGLCYGLDVPLIALSTLEIMADSVNRYYDFPDEPVWLCPMIDARRMEVYDAVYDRELNRISPVQAEIIDGNSFGKLLEKQKILFFGDGAAKCKEVIASPNALFIEGVYPLATMMAPLAEAHYLRRQFADTAYFEPFYLKEFRATIAKNKVFTL